MGRSRKPTRGSDRGRPPAGSALRWVLITGVTLLALLFFSLFGLTLWLKNYRNSEAFRTWLTKNVAAALKSDARLADFKWEGSSVYADGFQSRGYEDAPVARIELAGLRATFGGIRERQWSIPEATANRVTVEFSRDRLAGDFPQPPGSAAAAPASGGGVPSWLRRFIPTRFDLGEARVSSTHLRVLNRAGENSFQLRNVRSRFEPEPDGAWKISGAGGDLFLPGWPEMKIDSFALRSRGHELFLNQAAVDLYQDARVTATGTMAFATPAEMDLELRIANLDVQHVLTPEWKEKLSGRLHGTVRLAGRPGAEGGLAQSGDLHLKDGLLTAIPLLESIAAYTRNDRFKRLALNETSADFEKRGDLIQLRNLVVQSDGLSRLEGSLTIQGRAIDGNFQLGVTPGTLRWIPGAERTVFTQAEDGFLFTSVQVSGTLDNPKENLSARLIGAAVESLVEDAPQKALDTARDAMRDPAAAPGTLIDQGKKVLDSLVPLLK